jgi:hypothetical protein
VDTVETVTPKGKLNKKTRYVRLSSPKGT